MGFIAGGTDFEQISQDIIFDGETTNGTECFSLSITNDEVLENVENFTVVLHAAPDTAIVFVNSVLVVTISDDDCKLIPRCNKAVYLLILLDVAVTILAVGDVLEQDQVVEVCIVLTGSTAVNVAVILTAQEGGESPLGSNRVTILLPIVLPLRFFFLITVQQTDGLQLRASGKAFFIGMANIMKEMNSTKVQNPRRNSDAGTGCRQIVATVAWYITLLTYTLA